MLEHQTIVSNPESNSVDIIMATYNGEQYVGEQIESIFGQTHQNWRLIIRDDGSRDKTVAVLESYAAKDPRITILRDDYGNLGFNKNFLKLLSSTKANYIAICDQDDVWLPEKLALCLQRIQQIETKEKFPALVHSDAILTDSNLSPIASHWIGDRGGRQGLDGLLFANSVQGASTLINAKLKQLALDIPSKIPYDSHMAFLAEIKGRRLYISDPLLKYRQHSNNVIGAIKSPNKESVIKQGITGFFRINLLSDSLRISLASYPHIKENYAQIATRDNKEIRDYLYLFEGTSLLKKILIFIKHRYPFYRKKDALLFLLLLVRKKSLTELQTAS